MSCYFFGDTRFSVYSPGNNAWRVSSSTFKSCEDYKSYLFDDQRLGDRFYIFFELACPVYQEYAKKYNYYHIVHYSRELPEKWKKKLFEYSEKYSFILLDECDEDGHVSAKKDNIIRSVLSENNYNGVYVWFRVDDDDLLPVNYIDMLYEHVSLSTVGYTISFGEGVTAVYYNSEIFNFRDVYYPMLAVGQAYICKFDFRKKYIEQPLAGQHQKADRSCPVILDSRGVGFLWLRHLSQDTVVKGDAASELNSLATELSRLEKASVDKVKSSFPSVKSKAFSEDPIVRLENSVKVGESLSRLFSDELSSGTYLIKYRLRSSGRDKAKAALIKYNLEEKSGGALSKVTIPRSGNSKIGHYNYLKASQNESLIVFNLPDGVVCSSIDVCLWEPGSDCYYELDEMYVYGF